MIKGESNKREKDPIVCYECKKLGHIKFEYPFLKKKSKKAKQEGNGGHMEW